MGVSGTPVFPHMAGHKSTLPADRFRRGLGDHPTVSHDADLQSILRAPRENAVGWYPLPDFLFRRLGALDLFRLQPEPILQQLGGKLQPALEGLLPSPNHSDL